MHDNSHTNDTGGTSVLATLRNLIPNRRLRFQEALRLAEMQADRLLRLRGITDVPVPVEIVTDLPRIVVDYDPALPRYAASGASDWDNGRKAWVITINPEEPRTRQKYTAIHEYKHILDHYHPGLGGWLPKTIYRLDPVEYVAEYFAGCVLMPKRWVKAAYYDGIQRVTDLAELFDVSTRAMEVRLLQLGIERTSDEASATTPRFRMQPRGQKASATHRYRRPISRSWHSRPVAQEVTA